jgi:hypothetical protein
MRRLNSYPCLHVLFTGVLLNHLELVEMPEFGQKRFKTQQDDLQYIRDYALAGLHSVKLSIQLTREFSDGNIMLIYLYFRRCTLESLIAVMQVSRCHLAPNPLQGRGFFSNATKTRDATQVSRHLNITLLWYPC